MPKQIKLCKTCNEKERHSWRTECLSCIQKKQNEKAKIYASKQRAKQRVNVRLQWVDEIDRDNLRETIKTYISPFLKNKQIIIKVSKWKVKSEKQKLRDKLDSVFSLYIRKRDEYKCVICWSIENPQNWHLFSRVNLSTRWDEINCNCQCASCNILHENDSKPYTDWFIKNYWQCMYDDLRDRWHGKPLKLTNEWYEEKIAYYTN